VRLAALDMHMSPSAFAARQGQRLLQLGVLLLLYSSLDGFAIPYLGSQRIGLSVHTLSALQAILLLALGLVWFRLKLSATSSRIAFACLVYSTLSILAAYTVAAVLGVGLDTIRLMGELPHGLSPGTAGQERLIAILAYSSAPTGLASFGLIFWGLRMNAADSPVAGTRG
jgi:hydroxylaminobenzene mutase